MVKKERSKVTKAKAINKMKVVQRVTVNIGGRSRAGRKSTAPQMTQRPPPVQIFNSMAGPVPQGQGLGESMLQSAQILNRLLEPVNMRLDALVRRQNEPNGQPVILPPAPPVEQQFEENNNRVVVAEQPIEQLVEPPQAIVDARPAVLNDEKQAISAMDQPAINFDQLEDRIRQAEGLSPGKKMGPDRPNQFSKEGFLQLVSQASGRSFVPSKKALSFFELKAEALQFIRGLRQ